MLNTGTDGNLQIDTVLLRFDSKPNGVCNYMIATISACYCLLRCQSLGFMQEVRLASTAELANAGN